MSTTSQFLLGFLPLSIALLLSRWSSSYDIQGWLAQSVWRTVRARDWKSLKMPFDPDRDPVLKQQISGTVAQIHADQRRMGMTRAAGKHGALFALAFISRRFIVPPLWLAAAAIIAHALYRVLF